MRMQMKCFLAYPWCDHFSFLHSLAFILRRPLLSYQNDSFISHSAAATTHCARVLSISTNQLHTGLASLQLSNTNGSRIDVCFSSLSSDLSGASRGEKSQRQRRQLFLLAPLWLVFFSLLLLLLLLLLRVIELLPCVQSMVKCVYICPTCMFHWRKRDSERNKCPLRVNKLQYKKKQDRQERVTFASFFFLLSSALLHLPKLLGSTCVKVYGYWEEAIDEYCRCKEITRTFTHSSEGKSLCPHA